MYRKSFFIAVKKYWILKKINLLKRLNQKTNQVFLITKRVHWASYSGDRKKARSEIYVDEMNEKEGGNGMS